ncbi:hypothetical protein N7447_005523 [Penicillium robsamsonii]|uniref:uncharacterized protein n=1 Tax=Penicillium robsamsonii TaxID=1792511 RepID=UPI002548ECA1|nr:uncharacterized protein N7447_005523 [Penicillium robsamsonii]KAJ5823183.1 hypothetical protein N7447_005523 [Penicillium robsamsonii]
MARSTAVDRGSMELDAVGVCNGHSVPLLIQATWYVVGVPVDANDSACETGETINVGVGVISIGKIANGRYTGFGVCDLGRYGRDEEPDHAHFK